MSQRSARTVDPQGLQEVFRDLLRLAVVGDHVRWVVVGEGSAELAEWLREVIPQWREWADEVATYMATLEIVPDGRVKTLARDITRQWVPAGWLTATDARGLLAPRVAELIKWTQEQPPRDATSVDPSPLAEVLTGLRAQLRVLRQLVYQSAAEPARLTD